MISGTGRYIVAFLTLFCVLAVLSGSCTGSRSTCSENTQSEIQNSVKRYSNKTERRPGDQDAWYKLGMGYYKLGAYAQADQAFSSLLTLNQELPAAYVSRGICRLVQRDSIGACADFAAAVRLKYDPPVLDRAPVSQFIQNHCE